MNAQNFIESNSTDPYIADLCRRAVKVLNDQQLNRRQRELQIKRLQDNLLERQEAVAAKARRVMNKFSSKGAGVGVDRFRRCGSIDSSLFSAVLTLRKRPQTPGA